MGSLNNAIWVCCCCPASVCLHSHPQVVLDGTQIGALLLSLDLVLLLPDWAARGMAFALVTQMQTWQWVAFECLLPADSAASAAVVQTVLVLLLPGEHAAGAHTHAMCSVLLPATWHGLYWFPCCCMLLPLN